MKSERKNNLKFRKKRVSYKEKNMIIKNKMKMWISKKKKEKNFREKSIMNI